MNSVMLQVSNLSKHFGPVQAVRNLSFTVQKGEIFGFLGPNGAGKTTTMRILTGFIPADQGTFSIDGFDTRSSDMEIKRAIGYLPEHTPLYGDMFVEEYLSFAGKIHGLKGADLNRRIREVTERCSIGDVRKKSVDTLSKGYRQRVGLAQAILHDPRLLILDEPLSGLDPNQIIEIRSLIRELGQEKTVIYCSHILSEVDKTCDRLLIINEGQRVALDTPANLINQKETAPVYSVKSDVALEKFTALSEKSDHITSVQQPQPGRVQITCTKDSRGRDLFSALAEAGIHADEMNRQQRTLEDVFTELTAESEDNQ
ncbi:MAG: ABC transporter ATP-binding protein [Fibrobacterota bacterium]